MSKLVLSFSLCFVVCAFFASSSHAQCKRFTEKQCLPNLSPFTNNGQINNATLFVNANDIAQQLPLAIPMTAKGNVELALTNAEIDLTKNNQCIAATGTASWAKAGVVAFEQDVKLGKLNANIGCEKGALTVLISPKNDLGLTFTANLTLNGKASGNGFLKPGAKFPKELNNGLRFLGNKVRQGRYRLFF